MKIAIVGAGNIGTAMAALFASAGEEVTLVARGARLDAVARDGVCLDDRGTLHAGPVRAVTALDGVQDAVFLCVKAQDLGDAVAANGRGIGPDTLVIPMINGLPFWFFYDAGRAVPLADPSGALAGHLRPEQVLGAVLLMTVQTEASGRAVSTNTPTLSLAPVVDGADLAAVDRLIGVLNGAGVRTDLAPDIRQKVLVKLLANIATNPLSALLGCNLAEIGRTGDLLALAFGLADEVRAWAADELGRDLPDNDWLGALLLDAGDFPTSMLQDARAGRRLELDAIARAPLALAGEGAMPLLTALVAALDASPRLPLDGPAAQEARAGLISLTHPERIQA
ncbi:ketopantoate reductase family protein [Marinibacterium sp. SX1]|uniref:ketopantoate reductase family protein n=1 Tax=Marinibacterium sp. SX1 TaxID=3388424 RepID=UPI003D163846